MEPPLLRLHEAAIQQPSAADSHRRRTQKLFDLAVTATDMEALRVARLIGIDIRSMSSMRETPSLGYVGRIARALGIEIASAIDVVGASHDADQLAGLDRIELLARAVAADLDDDDVALDRLAAHFGSEPRQPSDLAVSMLLGARADVARGDVADAADRARMASVLGFDEESAIRLHGLQACIEIEAALGAPWQAWSADRGRRPRAAMNRPGGASAAGLPPSVGHDDLVTPLGYRPQAFELAWQALDQSEPSRGRVIETLSRLSSLVSDAAATGCTVSLAWVASIAGSASLRLLECPRLSARAQRAAMELHVGAQLSMEESMSDPEGGRCMALLRRRLRLMTFEWCDRTRRGEAAGAIFDEAEKREILAVVARFFRCRPIGPMGLHCGRL